jgi:ABC-type transporter Mla subunit MlaD
MLNYWYVWIIAVLLLAITAGFAMRFAWPALRLREELAGVIDSLIKIRSAAPEIAQLRHLITTQVMAKASFAHVWTEYAQTLHSQKQVGQDESRWRATALAETFFTDQALVDIPLKTDYYKHLPGIMTGLGIIGTFTGLIIGLGNFDVSIDPGQAQTQLRTLINTVGHAFIVSAIAITLAMVFTWIEKSLVTACYRLSEELRQGIDSLFDTGSDVEYLERLVAAAESSAKEALQLKETLPEQLVRAFAEQTQRQIDAAARNSERISADLGRVLAEDMSQPIADIASAVTAVGARQDEAVTRMITEVVSGFSQQMENLFAGQMRDLHEVQINMNSTMREMVAQFSLMAGQMGTTANNAVETMSSRIEATVTLVEERQSDMQEQARSNAEHLRSLMAKSQADSAEMLTQLLAKLGNEVAAVVGTLQTQAKSSTDSQQAQVEHLTETVSETVRSMSGQTERLVATSIITNQKLQETIEALTRATGDTIRGMNEGAEKLGVAASSFAEAGKHVASTLEGSAKVAEDVRLAADSLKDTAKAAEQMLGNYDNAHEAFAQLVSDLRITIDRAKREASLSAELTDRLESAARKLSQAQHQADAYLEGVSKVLHHSHQAFAESVERTLREANRQFHGELSQAVGLLSGAIVDLGDTVETLSSHRT